METQVRPRQRRRWRWILLCINIYVNICPVLTQHVKCCNEKVFYALVGKLQSERTQTELELPVTNATSTMAASVSPAGALRRKATDSR